MKLFKTTEKGYTLLFSVLVSSLTLAIGISILNIAKKEFLIATSTRDSTAALYAADSGLECALFGESGLMNGARRNAFDTGIDRTQYLGCNVAISPITRSVQNPDDGTGTFVFHAKFATEGTACAVVTVSKTLLNNRIKTTIVSRGYNTGWKPITSNTGTCETASAKRVERGLSYSMY
jgi:hypothetical protein